MFYRIYLDQALQVFEKDGFHQAEVARTEHKMGKVSQRHLRW